MTVTTQTPSRYSVASFAEAWIEIQADMLAEDWVLSPPSRRRGLKFLQPQRPLTHCTSPPSRRRGLKSASIDVFVNATAVASFAEAWIEIPVKLFA